MSRVLPVVPEHTILTPLGSGGMATVYLALDERLQRQVALKVMDTEIAARDATFIERFEREARTAAKLTHPHIVPIYQYGVSPHGHRWLTMAYYPDGSLQDRMRDGRLSVGEALQFARQISSGLATAHAQNVVHRDIKPDNILLCADAVGLTDFGIAKLLDSTAELTAVGQHPGTVRYMSPEQALGRPVDRRSDLYSLGVVLYEMLTTRSPTGGDTIPSLLYRIAHVDPEPLPPDLAGLQPLFSRLLAKHPDQRFADCRQLESVLAAIERDLVVAPTLSAASRSRIARHVAAVSGEAVSERDASPADNEPLARLQARIEQILLQYGEVPAAELESIEAQARLAGLSGSRLGEHIAEIEGRIHERLESVRDFLKRTDEALRTCQGTPAPAVLEALHEAASELGWKRDHAARIIAARMAQASEPASRDAPEADDSFTLQLDDFTIALPSLREALAERTDEPRAGVPTAPRPRRRVRRLWSRYLGLAALALVFVNAVAMTRFAGGDVMLVGWAVIAFTLADATLRSPWLYDPLRSPIAAGLLAYLVALAGWSLATIGGRASAMPDLLVRGDATEVAVAVLLGACIVIVLAGATALSAEQLRARRSARARAATR